MPYRTMKGQSWDEKLQQKGGTGWEKLPQETRLEECGMRRGDKGMKARPEFFHQRRLFGSHFRHIQPALTVKKACQQWLKMFDWLDGWLVDWLITWYLGSLISHLVTWFMSSVGLLWCAAPVVMNGQVGCIEVTWPASCCSTTTWIEDSG